MSTKSASDVREKEQNGVDVVATENATSLPTQQLKRQLKECFEESARQRGQLDELEKTVAKLTQELEEKKAQLARKGGRKSAPASQGAQAPDEGEPAKE